MKQVIFILALIFHFSLFSQNTENTTFFKTTPEVESELREFYGNNTKAIKAILTEVQYLEKENSAIVISTKQYQAVVDRFTKTTYLSESHRVKEDANKKKAFKTYVSVGELIGNYNSNRK